MFNLSNKKFLLTLAFIEGACVMAIELIGAKMIAPFFGSSLYVWASVLGVTLFSLMIGYYSGGYVSEKHQKDNRVLWVLLIGGVLISIMPYSSIWIMKELVDSSVQAGTTISLIVFLMPPLICMGMTSPMIINLINSKVDQSGKSAGVVYAISTFGGILGTFLTGFYLLPEYGVYWPCLLFGLLIMIGPVLGLFKAHSIKTTVYLIPFFVVLYLNSSVVEKDHGNIKLVAESEGIFGQIKIFDMPWNTNLMGPKKGRVLMVNNTIQSIGNLDDLTRDLWDYSYYFPSVASTLPDNSDVLLLGLGGGTLVHHFDRLGFNTDVVEIDERIKNFAIEYFAVNPKTNIIIDDARRYLNICKKKYNMIVMDLFLNETPPAHVLTVESFTRAKKLLKPGGIIMINFYGYTSGEKGAASRSIYKTLKEVGLEVNMLPTPGQEEHRNLFLIAGETLPDYSKVDYELPDLPMLTDIASRLLDINTLNLKEAVILRDSKPELEKMYLPAALEWRAGSIEYNLKMLIEENFY